MYQASGRQQVAPISGNYVAKTKHFARDKHNVACNVDQFDKQERKRQHVAANCN